jgi:hypothetical protein
MTGHDADERFEFGLTMLINGLKAFNGHDHT